RGGIAPAVDRRRAEDAVGVLRPWDRAVLAVDLGRRAEDDPSPVLVRGAEHVLRPVHVDVQHVVRVRDVVLDPNDAGKVVDQVCLRREAVEDLRVHPRVDDQAETALAEQVAHLRLRTRVERDHVVAAGEERLGEMRPDEPRAARDEDLHAVSSARSTSPRRAPGTSAARAASSSAPSSGPSPSWTRSRTSAPAPVATTTPAPGRTSSTVPGAVAQPPAASGRAHQTRSRSPRQVVNAPGYGAVTARTRS